ncbi:glycosyl hydrolase [Cryptosporangium minutisporangium]|uniref:Glycosyl hydrolase n=1 Tax=Cryptosporangium minutisporangium TaxID=113569 RepID=A0ABP6SRW6_9ACTN
MLSFTRRRLTVSAVALLMAAALVSVPRDATAADPAPLGDTFAKQFANPPAAAQPKIRYWWPCGQLDAADIDAEVKQIADRGFGAAEIACIFTTDPGQYGWGSPALTQRLRTAVEAGRKYGVQIDVTAGPAWPLVVPGLTPDSPQAAQELVYGRAVVDGGGTFSGPVPTGPAPRAGVTKQTLVAVQAVRCAGDCAATKPVRLDRASLVDLTGSVRNGAVTWRAPAGGQWLVLGFWQRGTGQASVSAQSVSSPDAYVVDHFSAAGARASTAFWDERVLSPQLRRLLAESGGDLFEDSLELDSAQHWTAAFLSRFSSLRGYSLQKYLPVVFIDRIHRQYTPVGTGDSPDFEFTDGSGARVREDYYRTLTDLYVAEHVKPLQSWAHSRGLRYRAQPYGTTIDTARVSAAVDVPETESLGLQDDYQDSPFRWVANGTVHLTGRPVYSLECCAVYNGAYGQTWPQVLRHVGTAFAHGVNQVVYHGFATENALGTPWPGFSPFTTQGGNGFSESWGPRQPTWADTRAITAWTARTQYVLRQGRPSVDLAVYRESYAGTAQAPTAGSFTYDYVGPDQLNAASLSGRRLAPDGPAYRAVVLDRQETLPLATARRLLAHARAGLPIVVVGDAPRRVPGAADSRTQDAALGQVVTQLLAQPSVRRIAEPAQLTQTLAQLRVRPAAEPTDASGLLTARRTVSGGDAYYLFNPTATTITTDLSLEGRGAPYALDAWTGRITPVGRFRAAEGRVTVPVRVPAGGSTLVAIGGPARPHATAVGEGAEVVAVGSELRLRAGRTGTYSVTRDNGSTAQVTVPAVTDASTPQQWKLSVDDWRRGPDGRRTVVSHELTLPELKPWSEIPELQDVSGVGTYSTEIRLQAGESAYLDLGRVTDTVSVTVNGTALPPIDQVGRRLDLGGYVKAGTNTLTIRVATPLRNRLRVTDGFPGQAAQPRQEYGLIGPVRLTPYREVSISG